MEINYKNLELSIIFRNPIEFINQWGFWGNKFRGILIWFLWGWINNTCNIWKDYGMRIIGIEINLRRYIGCC
jgi:hypothetical protein